MGKKYSVEDEIRLQEQLKELVEHYGIDKVQRSINKMAGESSKKEENKTEQEKALTAEANNKNHLANVEREKAMRAKSNLPPNVKTLTEFVQYASQLQRDKVREYALQKLKYFVDNARFVEAGEFKKIDPSFAMDLTEKELFDKITTPEEDWLGYNANIIKKQIKKKLRPIGYDFLDLEFEVGKTFNPNRHNRVGIEAVASKFKDNRVIRVVNEGLIIDKVLHINANVIVGQYKAGS